MVELTVDLGELSAPSMVRFGPFCWKFLHKGGGATPDNCKILSDLSAKGLLTERITSYTVCDNIILHIENYSTCVPIGDGVL